MKEKKVYALAFYLFTPVGDPHGLIKKHKKFFEEWTAQEVMGRIYISEQGINGQMSAEPEAAEQYMQWLRSEPGFSSVPFKIHDTPDHIFPRMNVKYRKQLVAIDCTVDISKQGKHVSPEEWKKMLESREYLLLDVRNQYEWEIGHFEGATLPPLEKFREFPDYAEKLSKEVDPAKTKVMMYCTGGIRCELYSALLKEKGFEEVYQLDGGVINYGLKEGNSHWKGKLFVFDDRLAVPIDGQESEPISKCCHCHLPCDTYYNCANMDCNELFIACDSCSEVYQGCCGHPCKTAPRVRAFQREGKNRPFRRKHLLQDGAAEKESLVESEG